MNSTPRLGLPLLAVGQAQKELAHNEAIQSLDALVGTAVEELPRNDPPAAPTIGAAYITGPEPVAEWEGKPLHIAAFTSGGWRLIAPREGMTAYVRSTGTWAVYGLGAWEVGQLTGSALVLEGKQVVGARAAAIPSASGGTTIDVQARAAVDQILGALRQHGLIES
jgi:hypothetical protein